MGLQQCVKHKSTYVHGVCLRCVTEDKRDLQKILELQKEFKKIPDYADHGSWTMAFKVFQQAKKVLALRSK